MVDVIYNGNGHTSGNGNYIDYGVAEDPAFSEIPVQVNPGNIAKSGATLKGWSFISNASSPVFTISGSSISPNSFHGYDNDYYTYYDGNMDAYTLYAVWENTPQATLTYNGNTNTGGSPPAAVTVNVGASTTVAGHGTLTKTNHNFKNWNTQANGSGTTYAVGAPITLNSNITLYAQWTETFSVSYNGNGHTGGSVPTNNNRYEQGQTFTAATQGTMVRSGYSFTGWNTQSNGSGTAYAANATVTMGSSNITLYAQWQQNQTTQYTVTFNANGASGTAPTAQTGNAGSTITLPGQGSMTYTNRNFKGWATSSGGGVAYAAGASYTLTSNTTLYAVWAQTYTITYNGNGHTSGTAPTNSNRYEQGQTFTAATKGTLAKTGHTFQRWNTNSAGTGTNYNENATVTMGSSDMTLYAVWLQDSTDTFTVTYTAGGASGTPPTDPNSPYTTGSTVTVLPPTGLSKTGYKFNGWNKPVPSGTEEQKYFYTGVSQYTSTCYIANDCFGVSFLNTDTCQIIKATLSARRSGAAAANALMAVQIYSLNGVFGSGSETLGTLLAQSDTVRVRDLPTTGVYANPLVFSGNQKIVLKANTGYFMVIRLLDDAGLNSSNFVNIAYSNAEVSHRGYRITAGGAATYLNNAPRNILYVEPMSSSIVQPGSTFNINSDVTLEATWIAANQVTVTYNGNGHTGGSVPSPQTDYETTIITVANKGSLVKANHDFIKWNTQSNGSGTDYLEGAPLTLVSNVTLYAIWEEHPKGTVNYNANTGSGTAPTSQTDYVGNIITVSNQGSLYKTGYLFQRWNTQSDGLGTDYYPNDPLTITGNVTLYAVWIEDQKYTLSYNGNGHTGGSVPQSQTDYVNTVLTVASKGTLVKTNWVFKNWNTQSDGSGITYAEGANLTLLDDVTLYAIWAPTFSVTYNGNGHTGGSVPTNANRYEQGQTFTAATKGTLVRANHDFVCWNTQSDGNGTSYNENATVTVGNSDLTLYAVWLEHPKYTLSYDGNGNTGGSAPSPQTDYVNTVVTVQNQGSLVKSNWTFKNWNTQPDGLGIDYAVGSNYTLTANLKLYAIWQENPKYTITYNGNGHTSGTVPTPQTDYVGTQIYVKGHGDLEKTGHNFTNWNTQPDGNGTTYHQGGHITLTQNITLYAQWSNIPTYTVTYAPGVYGDFEPEIIGGLLYGDPTPEPSEPVGQPGYSFSHWSPTPAATVTDNVTYTAQWTQDKYTVTYSPGTQGTFTQQVTSNLVYGDPTPSAPTVTGNAGYTFTGWNPTPTLTVMGTVEYIAQWSQDHYTVVYHPGTQGTWSAASQTTTNLVYGTSTPAFTGNTATDHNPGYTFSHWQPSVASTVTGNATYTAQWTQDKYTVTYAPGTQGTFSPQVTQNLVYGDPTPQAPTPTCNPGYIFDSWLPVPSATVTGNATYTAQWIQLKYSVTYDPGDHGDFTAQTTSNLVYGDPTPKAPEPIAEVGYVFDGWFPVPSLTVTGNAVYVAQWVLELYTVTFSPGLHGAFPAQITSGLTYGDPTPAPPVPTPAFGYTFAYWSPVIASTVTKSVTYTAIWNVILYYVTYDGNGANTGIPPIDTTPYSVENPYATVKGSGSLNKQKSDFDGWSTNPYDEKGVYKQGNTIHITSNTILYAIWVKRNMITQPNDCRWFWDAVREAKQEAGIPLNKNPYDP